MGWGQGGSLDLNGADLMSMLEYLYTQKTWIWATNCTVSTQYIFTYLLCRFESGIEKDS